MVLSIQDEDARDVELQREMQEAFEVYLQTTGEDRITARSRYLELLKSFATRVLEGQPLAQRWRYSSASQLRASVPFHGVTNASFRFSAYVKLARFGGWRFLYGGPLVALLCY